MFKYSLIEICEIIITIAIIITAVYRTAVVYDWLPEDFQPVTVVKNEYKQLVYVMQDEARKPTVIGEIANFFLSTTHKVEDYVAAERKSDAQEQQLEVRCQENGIFRFFMYLGAGDKTKCTDKNEMMNKAIQGYTAPPVKKTNITPTH